MFVTVVSQRTNKINLDAVILIRQMFNTENDNGISEDLPQLRNIKLQESLQLSAQWIVQKELQHTLKTKINEAKSLVVPANLLHP